jgi:competence protein ComEC
MTVVATLAAALGRPTAGIRILGLAVTALLLIDPLLVRSVGFGLSVCASAAILVLGPRLKAILPGPRWLVEPLSVTLAAQLGTMPLLIVTFGYLPVAAVPANLLAVPMAGPLMMWGLTAGLVAGMASPLAGVLHGPTTVMTWWLAWVAARSAALPLGDLRFTHAVVLTAVLAGLLLLRRWRPRIDDAGPERLAAVAIAGVLVVAIVGRPALEDGPREVDENATLWAAGSATALLIDGPVPIETILEALRQGGARCVRVVGVDGGGRSAAGLAAALRRRCGDALAVVAPDGAANPGWTPMPTGSGLAVGALRIDVTDDGHLRVGSSVDVAVARGPPR